MLVIVWLLPVPGGPLITNDRFAMAAAMHWRCEASASRTSGVRSGSWTSSIRSSAGGSKPMTSSARPASGPSPIARMSGLARIAASFSLRSWYIASLWAANMARTTLSRTTQPVWPAAAARARASTPAASRQSVSATGVQSTPSWASFTASAGLCRASCSSASCSRILPVRSRTSCTGTSTRGAELLSWAPSSRQSSIPTPTQSTHSPKSLKVWFDF